MRHSTSPVSTHTVRHARRHTFQNVSLRMQAPRHPNHQRRTLASKGWIHWSRAEAEPSTNRVLWVGVVREPPQHWAL